jgi:hypothetical protein
MSVHRLPGRFGVRGLTTLDAALRLSKRPSRLLVQYVPHMYGCKAMNVAFCAWVWRRRSFRPWVMFHEVAFPCRWRQPLRHNLLGAVNRLMASLIARAADRIFVSTPAWEPLLQRLAPLRERPTWLPVPSNITSEPEPSAVAAVRGRLALGPGAVLIGHFGTFGSAIAAQLACALPSLLKKAPGRTALLIGRGSEAFAKSLVAAHADLVGQVRATGALEAEAVAAHLGACDLLIQPYPDGITSRRTSLMAGLALGLPIVTTQGRSTEVLWHQLGLVALAPAGDTSALVAVAERLLADLAARLRLGERGRTGYSDYFSIDRTIQVLRS